MVEGEEMMKVTDEIFQILQKKAIEWGSDKEDQFWLMSAAIAAKRLQLEAIVNILMKTASEHRRDAYAQIVFLIQQEDIQFQELIGPLIMCDKEEFKKIKRQVLGI